MQVGWSCCQCSGLEVMDFTSPYLYFAHLGHVYTGDFSHGRAGSSVAAQVAQLNVDERLTLAEPYPVWSRSRVYSTGCDCLCLHCGFALIEIHW